MKSIVRCDYSYSNLIGTTFSFIKEMVVHYTEGCIWFGLIVNARSGEKCTSLHRVHTLEQSVEQWNIHCTNMQYPNSSASPLL
jgi:hypothetical protein